MTPDSNLNTQEEMKEYKNKYQRLYRYDFIPFLLLIKIHNIYEALIITPYYWIYERERKMDVTYITIIV